MQPDFRSNRIDRNDCSDSARCAGVSWSFAPGGPVFSTL